MVIDRQLIIYRRIIKGADRSRHEQCPGIIKNAPLKLRSFDRLHGDGRKHIASGMIIR